MQTISMQSNFSYDSSINSIRELSFEELDLISGADGIGDGMMGAGAIIGGIGGVLACFPATAPVGTVMLGVGGVLGGAGWIVDKCE